MHPKTYIIAEAGVNHNGDETLAYQMIDAAAKAGADAIKFQLFDAKKLTTRTAPKAHYQIINTANKTSQFEMLEALALSFDAFNRLHSYALKQNIDFMITPFDLDSLQFIVDLNLPYIKIGSGDITNGPLLLKAARAQIPIILSTGMSYLSEVELAIKVIAFGLSNQSDFPTTSTLDEAYEDPRNRVLLKQKLTLLHCTSEYPAPVDEVNLKVMDTLQNAFGVNVGLSDHTPGMIVSIAAVARNAVMLEKHFTLDKTLPGPDHLASLDIKELTMMIESVRKIEKALGFAQKYPVKSEKGNRQLVRRAIVANQAIKKGELFSEKNITVKRPAIGVSPMHFWDFLNKPACRDYIEDEAIS